MKNSNTRHWLGRLALTGLVVSAMLIAALPAKAALNSFEKQNIAVQAATLFRSARAVISKNQSLINDASKGDKGLSGDAVIATAKENYKKATGMEIGEPDVSTVSGQSTVAMFDAITEVMDQAQPLINEKGKGFKGFLPAIFAKQVADAFSKNMQGSMSIKLTAPKSFVRNRANRPDKWEHSVIENYFKRRDWQTGATHSEQAQYKGKDCFRFILPEYYKQSCLKCHGEPKGALDITGGKMEGGKLGQLGGAISVVIFD